jgi:benzoyl-CoA reductase subunit D
VLITGGLAADAGLAGALRERAEAEGLRIGVHTHPDSVHAGALGAALWGAYRHQVLARRSQVPA